MTFAIRFMVTVILVTVGGRAFAAPYCLAVRGNGEQMPAHWGGLAQTIETFGVPTGYAGGSSASITGFLLDSMIANPLIQAAKDERSKALILSTLIKSLEGIAYITAKDPKVIAITEAVQAFMKLDAAKQSNDLGEILAALKSKNEVNHKELEGVIRKLQDLGFTNGPGLKRLRWAYEKYKKSSGSKAELINTLYALKQSLDRVGRFDAKNDHQLFVRDGIVNFTAVANVFGKLADFYSATGASKNVKSGFAQLVEYCSAIGRTWGELAEDKPACHWRLERLMAAYFSENPVAGKARLRLPVGSSMMALISTGVILGKDSGGVSAERLINLRARYYANYDASVGHDFELDPLDVKYGYFGKQEVLNKIEETFSADSPDARIDKSQRFFGLGQVSWKTALLYSPAEPGLSSYIPYQHPTTKHKMLSIGGWSDLHPTVVLKAAGCPAVVYITRKGGDTIFGMGVAKRLFGFQADLERGVPEVPWEKFDPIWTAKGEPEDMTSQWSKMFNLANPNSNFAYSLTKADAVICTNWNSFNITKQFAETVMDSYHSPIYFPSESGEAILPVVNLKSPVVIGDSDNVFLEDGTRKYAGCIPLK